MSDGWLVLADGTALRGRAFGAIAEVEGEVVFNTSMTGYPELCTDPSYRRQILTLTVSEVGNYGVCDRDLESDRVQIAGLLVRSQSPRISNWRSDRSLHDFLADAGVPGLSGIDTRALVRHIRDEGAMMGVISTRPDADPAKLLERARQAPPMAGCALADEVTCAEPYPFTEGLTDLAGAPVPPARERSFRVVAVDYGCKTNILRLLTHHGCEVTVVPAGESADAILARKPDGVFLSNGPGDPATADAAVETVQALLGKVPIFGICMGHQVLSRALGASTYKTRFGHRGGNQPVLGPDGRVLITSQNHGFAVAPDGLKGAVASHLNLSDETNEGVDAPELNAFSVQYHPEAAPGPHDARPHFEEFVRRMEAAR